MPKDYALGEDKAAMSELALALVAATRDGTLKWTPASGMFQWSAEVEDCKFTVCWDGSASGVTLAVDTFVDGQSERVEDKNRQAFDLMSLLRERHPPDGGVREKAISKAVDVLERRFRISEA